MLGWIGRVLIVSLQALRRALAERGDGGFDSEQDTAEAARPTESDPLH